MLIDGPEEDYCNVFFLLEYSHADGTHSLQRIH